MTSITLAYWLGGIVCGTCGFGVGWILGRKWGTYIGTYNTLTDMLSVPGVKEALDKEVQEIYRIALEREIDQSAESARDKDNAEEE